MQNTPKNWDIQCNFSDIGKFAKLSVQLTSNLIFLVENSEKSVFSAKRERIFKY